MATLVKLDGCSRGRVARAETDEHDGVTWVRTDQILEICPLEGDYRERIEVTEDKYDRGVAAADADFHAIGEDSGKKFYRYVESAKVVIALPGHEKSGEAQEVVVRTIRPAAAIAAAVHAAEEQAAADRAVAAHKAVAALAAAKPPAA